MFVFFKAKIESKEMYEILQCAAGDQGSLVERMNAQTEVATLLQEKWFWPDDDGYLHVQWDTEHNEMKIVPGPGRQK